MLIDFKQLFPRYNLSFTGVLHIGANRAEERFTYSELSIHKQIWIEANSELFPELESNLKDFPGAKAFNYAIGSENKEKITLNISSNGSQSSSILELGTHKDQHPDVHYTHTIEVEMKRIDTLFPDSMSLAGCDLLNIDIQGYELEALRGMGDIVKQFKACYLEVNKGPLYVGCPLVEDLDFYLAKYDFQRVETKWAPNKDWGDALWVKRELLPTN